MKRCTGFYGYLHKKKTRRKSCHDYRRYTVYHSIHFACLTNKHRLDGQKEITRYALKYHLRFFHFAVYCALTLCSLSFFLFQRSALVSVLEMLESSNIEPKIRKSALVQLCVMLTDISLHKVFISQNGLPIILDIFSKALVRHLNFGYSFLIAQIYLIKVIVF